MLDPQIEIADVQIKVRQNELILDETPNDASHLIPIQFDNRVCDFDFCHAINFGGTGNFARPIPHSFPKFHAHAHRKWL
ncbi:MAG: hypothetical protein BWY82_02439 [Verrucomicrobia bacterium ADurb.Bin474]|nr:MAG: hypothetical protein BWY82_02439 [Verrucomicrobia bacterium ADurb.Bin474]